MTTKISEANIQPAALSTLQGGGGPKIASITVTDNSYADLDDTAVALTGGYIKLTGSGFASGCQVLVGATPASSVTFVSATEVRAQLPATAAGTYIVYLVNSDGGTAIRINAVTFSGTPTWVTGSTLADEADKLISIQFAAADAAAYAVAAGSSLPNGLTLSSSGLLSGTVTGITQDTVYNFVVNAIDTELQDSPRSFAFTITVGDEFFNRTALLLTGRADTFVKDVSTNNFPVTIAGDTKPTNFNPYLTCWSNYFGSASSSLTVADNIAWDMDTDYSIEAFCYLNSYNTTDQYYIVSQQADPGQRAWGLALANGKLQIYYSSTGASQELFVYSNSFTVTANQWYHFAVTRTSAGVYTFYVNGVATGTITNTAGIFKSNQPLTIGQFGNFGISSLRWDGYISNLRILRGATAYAANFTPSTAPLTAIAGTVLLTCQSNRIVDNSTNNFTITRNGDVAVRSFSPFVEPISTRGSAYFDGTGDYLTLAENSAFDFGTGDFTVEAWVYPINNGQLHPTFLGSVTGWSAGASGHRFNNTGYANKFWFGLNGSGGVASGDPFMVSANTFAFNTWYHYSITRTGNTFRMFVNGVLENTQTFSGSYNAGLGGLRSGWSTWDGVNGHFTGSVSDLRLVKGTAVYTTNFTPPAAPLTAIPGTSLLTLQNNTPAANNTFVDSSSVNNLITRAGNATQGSFSPYSPSGWSNYFDGTGDYLTTPQSSYFTFNANFTIEFWIYNSVSRFVDLIGTANNQVFIGAGQSGWIIGIESNGGIRFSYQSSNSWVFDSNLGMTLSLNSWNHIAIVRNGSAITGYLNGVAGTTTITSSATLTSSLYGTYIGAGAGNQNFTLGGNISNLRIVNGTAVYTSAFTPSTQPLTAIPGTVLLTCADNRFVDESPNNFAITRNGDTRVTNFSPFKAVVQTPTTYSASFDGTGDFLTTPSSTAFDFGTDSFTVECWVYARASGYQAIVGTRTNDTGSTIRWSLFVDGSNFLAAGIRNTADADLASFTHQTAVTLNQWNHVALVRNGTSFSLYLNGVRSTTNITSSAAVANNSTVVRIGDFESSVISDLNGYVSNLRIVKGTAVYTTNFTPSTQPLTAIAGTSLLTCQSATFVDNSTNRFAITAAGDARPTTVNPFGFTFNNSQGYTAAEHGGSMSFDGSGDYLTGVASSTFAFAKADFTVEMWIYPTATITTPANIGLFYIDETNALVVGLSNGYLAMGSRAVGYAITSTFIPPVNTWTHVVVIRAGATARIFANGVQVGTVTATGGDANNNSNYVCTTGLPTVAGNYGGGAGNGYFPGYVSNLRVVKGTAVYTSNFVPPVAPVQLVQNTTLLLNGTGAAIGDATTKNNLETVGDARISTAVSKFGGSSMGFDGSGDRLIVPSSVNFDFPANFTIEMWINFTNVTSTWQAVVSRAYQVAGGWRLYKNDATNQLSWWSTSTQVVLTSGSPLANNTWSHVAVVRNSGTVTIYIDGINRGSAVNATSYTPGNYALEIGEGVVSSAYPFQGYMQDLRITNGVARYTANFTPPTRAFQVK